MSLSVLATLLLLFTALVVTVVSIAANMGLLKVILANDN